MTTDADLTNAVVAQNDEIVRRINAAEDGAALEAAYALVKFVAPVWDCIGYGYKADELKRRVERRARFLADGERNYLSCCRKNCRTRAATLSSIAKLESLEVVV